MSTVPGSDAWRDAGLVGFDPAEAVELEREAEADGSPPSVPDDADPADLIEQLVEVPADDRDEYP